ncbi:MAG TPA: phage portal protein [Steroidobacteraceae bacterium]|nr:phage portal protein [Steroidobacteraceae bacterium]
MANWLTRMLPWGRAGEGQYRPGPYLLSHGWLPAGSPWNYWQSGQNVQPYGERSAMLEACVSAYSQTVPMCPGDHWRLLPNGGRERVTNSALARIMRRPNDYQSISDFLLNLTRRLYERGETFAFAVRNNRAEIGELHLMRDGTAQIAEDGSIFYSLSGNEIIERRIRFDVPIPARDVLHVRLHTPRHPLKGESPILSAALDMAMSGAALSQQVAFYLNQARPSFLLETDLPMKRDQALELRAWWDSYTQAENAGKTPILTHGLKAHPIQTNAVDGQLVEMLKMTDQAIALALRIPLQILGIGGTTYSSTELLMQDWIAKGLGFTLNHIEEAFGQLFQLRGVPDEYLELDTRALLRSAYRERIEGLARGVISGIYSPDEARAQEDLPAVPDGHGAEPRVQQQVVPLSYGSDMQPPTPQPAQPAADGVNSGDVPADGSGDATKFAEWAARGFDAEYERGQRAA